ncbi:MAG: NYN domain-containing protein [Dehalococcoidia bacterium]
MAVDLSRLAQRGEYDVGIVCTGDTDLIPAVEDVLDTNDGVRVEVAAWRGDRYRQRLSLPGRNIWCHWLRPDDYEKIRDDADYTQPRA